MEALLNQIARNQRKQEWVEFNSDLFNEILGSYKYIDSGRAMVDFCLIEELYFKLKEIVEQKTNARIRVYDDGCTVVCDGRRIDSGPRRFCWGCGGRPDWFHLSFGLLRFDDGPRPCLNIDFFSYKALFSSGELGFAGGCFFSINIHTESRFFGFGVIAVPKRDYFAFPRPFLRFNP